MDRILKNNQKAARFFGVVVAFVLISGNMSPATAALVNEVEPNDTVATAQNIDGNFTSDFDPNIGDATTNTSTTIPHVTIAGSGNGTHDHYSFTVNSAGAKAIFDIDFGTTGGPMDAFLDLFDSSGTLLASNDDESASFGQGGSVSSLDSYLEYTFSAPGVYVIRVGEFPGGRPIDPGADYQLQVSLEQFFDSFSIEKAEIEFDDDPAKDDFKLKGTLSTSDGIDPLVDEVIVRLGTASITIPAGSFEGGYPEFEFEGIIGGTDVEMDIEETDIINTFEFKVKGKGVDLTGTANPLDIGLQIGSEKGQTDIKLEGQLEFEREKRKRGKYKGKKKYYKGGHGHNDD